MTLLPLNETERTDQYLVNVQEQGGGIRNACRIVRPSDNPFSQKKSLHKRDSDRSRSGGF